MDCLLNRSKVQEKIVTGMDGRAAKGNPGSKTDAEDQGNASEY